MHTHTHKHAHTHAQISPYNRQRKPRGELEVLLNFFFNLGAVRGRVVGQRHAPAVLPPGKICYPLYRRLGGPQGRSGGVRKISPQPGFDPRTFQPVAIRYTDRAIASNTHRHIRHTSHTDTHHNTC